MMSEYKEIIVALIAVFGVVIPYLIQRNKEHRLKIAERKSDAYSAFLRDFTETALRIMHDEDVSGKEMDRQRMLARGQLLLYASDEVIKAYNKWIRYADRENHDIDKEGELVNELFLAIRRDVLCNTRINADELANMNPFNRG